MKVRRLLFLGILSLIASAQAAIAEETIRVGHFPNITHVQGLVAQHLSRTGRGWFEERLGTDVKIEWYIYNAGLTSTYSAGMTPANPLSIYSLGRKQNCLFNYTNTLQNHPSKLARSPISLARISSRRVA